MYCRVERQLNNLWRSYTLKRLYVYSRRKLHGSQWQRVTNKFPNSVPDRSRRRARQIIVNFKQVRLYVRVRCVEYQVRVGATRHFRNVFVAVYDLRDENYFVLQHFDNAFMFAVHIVFVSGLGEFTIHCPYFPGHALRLKGPTRTALLEELQAYRAFGRRGSRLGTAKQLGEVWYFAFNIPPERFGLAAHVCEIDEVAVNIDIAHGTDRVALFAIVCEFAAGPMEKDRVEYACHHLVHLSSFHGQLEGDAARVHGAGAEPSVARRETARRHWHNRTHRLCLYNDAGFQRSIAGDDGFEQSHCTKIRSGSSAVLKWKISALEQATYR